MAEKRFDYLYSLNNEQLQELSQQKTAESRIAKSILSQRNKNLTEKKSINTNELTSGQKKARLFQAVMNSKANQLNAQFADSYKKASLAEEQKRRDKFYNYKLITDALATAAELGSSYYMLGKGLKALDMLPNTKVINGIYASDKGQIIASGLGGAADTYQFITDPSFKNRLENGIEIPLDIGGVIGGTNVVRNSSFFGKYGKTIDTVLDMGGYGAALYDGILKPINYIWNKAIDNTTNKQ